MSGQSRYQVQERFPHWGAQGQARLAGSTAVIVGVGALGGHTSGLLARAGVGALVLIDPDRPSLDNLHRQVLYTEQDVARGYGKAATAARALERVNSQISIQAHFKALDAGNAVDLLSGADVVLDCLDNMEARFLLNEACHKLGIPWVHAGVMGAEGQLMVVRPGQTPCLRCWTEPAHGRSQARSVDTVGVTPPIPACLGSLQAMEALKLLMGQFEAVLRGLLRVELWPPRFHVVESGGEPSPDCPACNGNWEFI